MQPDGINSCRTTRLPAGDRKAAIRSSAICCIEYQRCKSFDIDTREAETCMKQVSPGFGAYPSGVKDLYAGG
jgi:hypothetical protein